MNGDEGLRAFVDALPKCEVHLHLEGAVPLFLARAWGVDEIDDPPFWHDPAHRYVSFLDFIHVLNLTWRGTLNSLERLAEVGASIYEGLRAQNVRYVEMSFGLGAYPYPVAETVSALKSRVPDGMTVRLIGGISRDRDLAWMMDVGKEAVWCDSLDGLDVHGDERTGDLRKFSGIFQEARSNGKITKAHAGEFGGPVSIHKTLDILRVKRIQHGIRAVKDASLVSRLVDEGITLDLCPWSNVKLGAVESLAGHPLPEFHRSGIRVSVNTDDPTLFGQTLTDEYCWLGKEMGLSYREIGAIASNPFKNAAMHDYIRDACLKEIDSAVVAYEVNR